MERPKNMNDESRENTKEGPKTVPILFPINDESIQRGPKTVPILFPINDNGANINRQPNKDYDIALVNSKTMQNQTGAPLPQPY